MSSQRIIIIGGGAVGLNTAYQLARRNAGHIVLLEKERPGDGSSSRAAGIGTHLMWSETGVLARKLGFSLFREFRREWNDFTFHSENGCLNIIAADDWPAREKLLPLYERLDVQYEVLNSREVHQRWSAIQPQEDHVGLFDPLGGYSDPAEFVPALARRVQELGVEVVRGETVEGILTKGDGISGVRTSRRIREADVVVSTVHAWSLPLWRDLGLRLPMKHFVHQRYLSTPLAAPFVSPAINADPYLGYIRPAAGNRILMGVEAATREEYRVDSLAFRMDALTTSTMLRDEASERLSQFAPVLEGVEWESEKIGLISFSLDGEPLLGPVQRIPGLYIAASFHSGGYSYSPVAGYLLSELITNGKASVDFSPFAPDRFTPIQIDEHLAMTVTQSEAIRRRH